MINVKCLSYNKQIIQRKVVKYGWVFLLVIFFPRLKAKKKIKTDS